ncbi:hypothetical protein Vadar_012559 [Vaccinium darrowii]|uniref:Uncharacterized protein n=1 Tax=Vaccinium darrowii TaxID=229202 RepID=A0ACB7XYN6_9ERIC|nr:hypothetical protein Vadar_012559 [Vaccinium darrowii]
MAVSMVLLKVPRRDKKNKEHSREKRPTLKELQEKRYTFPDSDVPSMLEDLLEKNVIQLPECKRLEEMGKNLFHPHQVKKWQVKKSFPQFTERDEVNDGKDKKEKVFEKSSPTPITQHDFFPEEYFDDNCFQIVYMISADEGDDISQSFTHRVSAFDRIEAPTIRTSVFERLN